MSLLHPLIHSVREKDSYGPKELLGRILGEIAPFLDQVDGHPLKLKLFFAKMSQFHLISYRPQLCVGFVHVGYVVHEQIHALPEFRVRFPQGQYSQGDDCRVFFTGSVERRDL